ncbi:MAG: hypothetical protein WA693_22525, partial [Pseudolabrys sp.]
VGNASDHLEKEFGRVASRAPGNQFKGSFVSRLERGAPIYRRQLRGSELAAFASYGPLRRPSKAQRG